MSLLDTSHEPLPLAIVGCDFRVASTKWRSSLVLSDEDRARMVTHLLGSGSCDGVAFLDTCNRNEWICSTDQPDWTVQLIAAQFTSRWHEAAKAWKEPTIPQPRLYVGEDAVRHILRVSLGLESLVTAEAEIAGQIQRALANARQNGHTSVMLNGLGNLLGRLSREAHRAGLQGGIRRGIHGLVLEYLAHHLPNREAGDVLVVGLGEIGRKTATLLEQYGGFSVQRFNRTVPIGSSIRPLETLNESLNQAQALVFASGAQHALFTSQDLLDMGVSKDTLVVDIGVPPQVDHHPDAPLRYVGLDELVPFVTGKQGKADQDRLGLVENGVREFTQFCRERSVVPILDATQRQHEDLITHGVARFINETLPDLAPEEKSRVDREMKRFVRDYTNKVIESIHRSIGQSKPEG